MKAGCLGGRLAGLLMGVALNAGCATTSRDALIAATEHRLEEARAHDHGGESGDEAAFEVYDAEEHLEKARAARDGRFLGGTSDAREAFSSAEQAAVLPR